MKKFRKTQDRAFTLIEMLIVVGIFAVLGILVTRSIILTLAGSRKSQNLIKVSENLNYSLGIIERQLRSASSITDTCPNNTQVIDYLDQNGTQTSFSCLSASGIGYIASGSSRLTDSTVNVTSCSFVCTSQTNGNPTSVKINVTAKDATAVGTANSVVTDSTEVFLRNY